MDNISNMEKTEYTIRNIYEVKQAKAHFIKMFLEKLWCEYGIHAHENEDLMDEHPFSHFLCDNFKLRGQKYPELISRLIEVFDGYDSTIEKDVVKRLSDDFNRQIEKKDKEISNLQMFIKMYLKESSMNPIYSPCNLPDIAGAENIKKKWVNLDEAAAFLGMSVGNVRYYRDKGILVGKLHRGLQCVNAESLTTLKRMVDEKRLKSTSLQELLNRKEDLKLLTDEYDKVEKELTDHIHAFKRVLLLETGVSNEIICKRLELYIQSFRGMGIVSDRDLDIVEDFYVGSDFAHYPTFSMIAEKHRLSLERIRQILLRAQRRMLVADDTLAKRANRLSFENEALRTSLSGASEEYGKAIMRKKAMLEEMAADSSWNEEKRAYEEAKGMLQFLKTTKVVDCDFKRRAQNCLRALDIETLYELVQLQPTDLLKARNFGRKGLGELEEVLESMDLHLGTDYSDLNKYVAENWNKFEL